MRRLRAVFAATFMFLFAASVASAAPAPKITWDSPDISWRKDTSPVKLSIYIDYSWYGTDVWGKDDISPLIQKATGVSLEVTKGTDPNQIQVLVAGGKLPDLVFCDIPATLFQRPEVSYSYNELIQKYAPELMDLIDPLEVLNNTMDDGRFYSLRSHYTTQADWDNPLMIAGVGTSAFHVRKDILDTFGTKSTAKVEDIPGIFAQVKAKYPDMSVYGNRSGSQPIFMSWMGLGYNMLDVSGGNVNINFFSLKDRWLEYYKLMNSMFQNGYFTRETWTLPYAQTKQIAQSGRMFSMTANCPASDELNTVSAQNKDAQRFTPIYPPPTYKGKVLYSPLDMSIGWACLFITKNCSKPDRAIRFVEYLKSPEGQRLSQWGVEGTHYQRAQGGLITLLDRYLKFPQAQHGLGLWYFEASPMNESIVQGSLKISAPDFSTQVDLMQAMKPYFMRNPALYRAVNPEGNSDAAKVKAKVNDIFRKADIEMMCATSAAQIEQLYNKMLDDMRASNYGVFEKYLKDTYAKDRKKYDDYNASLKK